ncbi:putative defensin-like protein 157 [Durio zibethinus]|uniref:Defensin-like protein 157 n=1 Tax=Durio zibethinus TaxID=66656 RepID=A0A6P6ANV7_DURZI|nr:putative defensin-like protein 157 [Durio zibethinus]
MIDRFSKMSKLSCNIFFAILLIFTVALTMHQVHGQEMCHGQIPGNGSCDAGTCNGHCAQSFPGSMGTCVQTYINRYNCHCTWPCS